MTTLFNSFAVGDVTTFEHSFDSEDFVAFSRLSGDTNPSHDPKAYAQGVLSFPPTVPLHLTLMPLSRMAGLAFPGEPSLCLGTDVRAVLPVYYGETLCYSARIQSVNSTHRVLTLRVLALRNTEVVLEAGMRVQATADEWSTAPALPIFHTAKPGRAVVTGASGAIGSAIALALASRKWALLLQDRGDSHRRQFLRAALERLNADANFVSADLATESGRMALGAAIADYSDVEAVIHAASPGLTAPLERLVAVNYSAFKEVITAVLPNMLARQKGRILLIGSTAMLRCMLGWEDYAAAKTMVAGLVTELDKRFSAYGVRGLVLMAGYVATTYSNAVRGDAPALLPQEVAETVTNMLDAPEAPVVVFEVGRHINGTFGFTTNQTAVDAVSRIQSLKISPESTATDTDSVSATIGSIVREVLRLPLVVDLSGGGIGITPRWDSLRQIEVILALESRLGIQFTSNELAELGHFDALVAACQRKISRL